MPNPLFGMMQNSGLIQQFNQFRQSLKGDPNQLLQQMMNSGRVNQNQYNQAVQMAQNFQRMMGGK